MTILTKQISLSVLKGEHCRAFSTLTKAVVDIDKGVMAVDAELHADQEEMLLQDGSRQESLWGINLYPDRSREDFIEYTSLINIRPRENNMSMEVESEDIRQKVRDVVFSLVNFDA
ncbi:MAG: hypothetical protein GF418_02060 [Chitinivibrionales bacterium]|nr:hypothetical protein [Chitinivibrionales bacterium]MBD3394385.1 hypothetical protein [Chitinivibrionales bacterium]